MAHLHEVRLPARGQARVETLGQGSVAGDGIETEDPDTVRGGIHPCEQGVERLVHVLAVDERRGQVAVKIREQAIRAEHPAGPLTSEHEGHEGDEAPRGAIAPEPPPPRSDR